MLQYKVLHKIVQNRLTLNGAAVDCSPLPDRARQATLVDPNATNLKIFNAGRYDNYKYSALKGLTEETLILKSLCSYEMYFPVKKYPHFDLNQNLV